MVSHLFFYQLVLVALVWLCVMLHWAWPSDPAAACPTTPEPPCPLPKHHREPSRSAGLTRKPPCAACAQAHAHGPQPPGCPRPRIVPTRGRPRQVDTSCHFCPNATCAYRGWVSWGNLRANGHPSGGPCRQWYCTACKADFLQTHGTLSPGKRGAPHVRRGPGCVSLLRTAGFRAYTAALRTHSGPWVQRARRRAQGPMPKPRWMPRAQLLYAQVLKTVRRRRLVRVCPRVVLGPVEAVPQV